MEQHRHVTVNALTVSTLIGAKGERFEWERGVSQEDKRASLVY